MDEHGHIVKKDIRQSEKAKKSYHQKYDRFVGKLFSNIWKSLDQRASRSMCENPNLLDNQNRCKSTNQKFNYVLRNHPKVFSFQISYLIEFDDRGLDKGSDSADLLKLM